MYTNFLKIPHSWGLKNGDIVLLSSDVTRLSFSCIENGEIFDANMFLDEILSIIGPEGTLLLPTYNWDFCHGVTFDYYKTPCKTGALGKVALKRVDFKRTHHPIYSFAVKGKYQDLLCDLNNVSSFGGDSPFAFLEMIKAKSVSIDVDMTHYFTFVHYVEERAGIKNYRYPKFFTANYRDEKGNEKSKTYSMLVRDMNDYYETDFSLLEQKLQSEGVMLKFGINEITYRITDFFNSYPIIMDDIHNNCSRSICKHKWQ